MVEVWLFGRSVQRADPCGGFARRRRTCGRFLERAAAAGCGAVMLAASAVSPGLAQDKEPAAKPAMEAADGGPTLNVELNTIEQQEDACRVYLVVKNESEDRFTDLEMELILFDKQGFVSRRYAVQIAPLQPNKTRVRPFDLPELDCQTVGQFLINDVTKCAIEAGEKPDCLRRIQTESKGEVHLFM